MSDANGVAIAITGMVIVFVALTLIACAIAALPRIVTLHDINITPENDEGFDNLSMEVTAKTYRYLDEEAL